MIRSIHLQISILDRKGVTGMRASFLSLAMVLATTAAAVVLDISVCGSSYDTALYVYDGALNEIACNDDFCGLQSQLENVSVAEGQTCYIVVDGYGTAAGSYVLHVQAHVPCVVPCPLDSCDEGEPPLGPDYVDAWNGGCDSPPGYPFWHIFGAEVGSTIPVGSMVYCGGSGWYYRDGVSNRDTDWFTLTVGSSGSVEIVADAEYASYVFELSGTCEGGVFVEQQAIAGPCQAAAMTMSGAAGSTKRLWVGPTSFVSPDATAMYDWVLWFSGLQPEIGVPCHPVDVEPTS
jgi:hypothetical protein